MNNSTKASASPSKTRDWTAVAEEIALRSGLTLNGSGGQRAMRCPCSDSHNDGDADPSASINLAKGVWFCHGCGEKGNMQHLAEALGLGGEWPGILDAAGVSKRFVIQPASELKEVARWLRKKRHLPHAEVGTMFAAATRRGPAVVFRYDDEGGKGLYDKFRLIKRKAHWRSPAGAASVLYGLSELHGAAPARVVIVEGELDCHALRAVGVSPVVSVPNGAKSKLTQELLAPLARFERVVIATDADEDGEELAQQLAAFLGVARCHRARFTGGES